MLKMSPRSKMESPTCDYEKKRKQKKAILRHWLFQASVNIPVLNWTPCKADTDQQTSFEDVLNLLHLNPPDKCKIAVEKPVCIKRNCRIIDDNKNLGHPDDVLADDSGVWSSNGSLIMVVQALLKELVVVRKWPKTL